MMRWLYLIGIFFYKLGINLASPFKPKAKKWIEGRKNWRHHLKRRMEPGKKSLWFHCASLGEFEQGRPLIEKCRKLYPDHTLVLTFFSPSGYEIRKDYPEANTVVYLPLDTRANAEDFIQIIKPAAAFFIKYEFWYHYIQTLNKKKIPVFLVSGIFRPQQVFFKFYGGWFRKILEKFTFIFVQDEASYQLLNNIGIKNSLISGDTRFDRVNQIAGSARPLTEIDSFANGEKLVVFGSTWPQDEKLIIPFINNCELKVKFIIAPHEISTSHLDGLEEQLDVEFIRYSNLKMTRPGNYRVLLVDNIGMLGNLYMHASVAYIGGGFGAGIHNILEASTHGKPVLFGPNYKNFKEARDLIERKGAFSISSFEELNVLLRSFLMDNEMALKAGNAGAAYVKENVGATEKILTILPRFLPQ